MLQNYSNQYIADDDKAKVTNDTASGQAPTWLNKRDFLTMINKLSKHKTWSSKVTEFLKSQNNTQSW